MTPLVLLPGMMCDARLFAPQIAAFSGERVVHVAPIGARDTVTDLASDVLDHAPPTFALAGLSMGGIVAMEIAAQAPERVAGLALLDTNPLAEAVERQALRDVQMAQVKAGDLERVMREEMKPLYLADGPRKQDHLDLCMDMALSLGSDVFQNQSLALASRPDQRETLRALQVPSLILCGQEDSLCPVARHEMMRDLIPDAVLAVIEDAGHLPVLEQPKATNHALKQWLLRLA